MEEISEQIGNNIKKLKINNEENHQLFLESAMANIVKFSIENQGVPFLTFITCTCGCGSIHHIVNLDVLSKQKTPEFLEAAAKKTRDEMKNVN